MFSENDILLNPICIQKRKAIQQTARLRLAVPQNNPKYGLEWY